MNYRVLDWGLTHPEDARPSSTVPGTFANFFYFYRLELWMDGYIHRRGHHRRILITSQTHTSSRFLLDICLSKFPGLKTQRVSYLDSRLSSSQYHSTREYIQEKMRLASLRSEQILIIEGLEMLCPEGDCSEAVLEELLFWLEGSMASQMVVVMTEKCTGQMHKILESIFSDKLEIPTELDKDDRAWVLKTLNDHFKLGISDELCAKLSKETKATGFEGLLSLVTERYPLEETIDDVVSSIEGPSWMLVQGQDEAKERLLSSARFLWDDGLLKKYLEVVHISPNLGILLYGPPGTGKTLLAKEIARLKNIHFHAVTIPELVHAEIGRSEQSLAEVFRLACAKQPAILFIDELEAIFAGGGTAGEDQHTTGSKLLSQLMIEFDRLYSDEEFKRVLVIGATNRLDALDSSLLRFGRFGECIPVLPESGYNVPARIIHKGLELLLNEGLVDAELMSDGAIEAIIEAVLGPDEVISGAEAAQILEDVKRSAMHSHSAVSKAILESTLSYYK